MERLRLVSRYSSLGRHSKAYLHCSSRQMATAMSTDCGPVESSIRGKLTSLFEPTSLTITNDSWKHRHHMAMRQQEGGNGETHFSIAVVSSAFKGKNLMQRHRMIYEALADELLQGLHALSLSTKTLEESPVGSP